MSSDSITDYSATFKVENVAKLAANGCLMHENGRFLLLQTLYESKMQQLAHVDAPIQASMFFVVREINEESKPVDVGSFSAEGTPGQCYNYAATQFEQRVSKLVDESQ